MGPYARNQIALEEPEQYVCYVNFLTGYARSGMGWEKENIPRLRIDRPWKYVLIPGLVIQWFMYMFPSGKYASVVSSTRISRSQIGTYFYSSLFYALTFICVFSAFAKGN